VSSAIGRSYVERPSYIAGVVDPPQVGAGGSVAAMPIPCEDARRRHDGEDRDGI